MLVELTDKKYCYSTYESHKYILIWETCTASTVIKLVTHSTHSTCHLLSLHCLTFCQYYYCTLFFMRTETLIGLYDTGTANIGDVVKRNTWENTPYLKHDMYNTACSRIH